MPGRAAGVWRRKGGWAGGRREKDSDQPLGASYPRAPALWWCSYHRRSWCFLDLSAQAAQAAQEDLEEENREGREQGGSTSLSGTWRRRARRNSGTGAAAPTPHPRLKRWRDRAAATRCRAGLWHGAGSAATEAAAGRSGARRSGLHGPRGRGLLSSSRP
ncbi:unnamed protein product [Prorocentrum cordatum]|uniref:Uncharacterized protein n=1 Tax=Prorocentrum cordatum TaxID=2364126 RepID=A0ABN9SY55_9DINO|nr:unnamed protein product [Polarella glacialis]